MNPLKSMVIYISIVLLVLLETGCAGNIGTPPSPEPAIDPRFAEFYNLMGGEYLLGRALGAPFEDGSRLMQFTENTLISYDESLPVGERFNFEPLGGSFNITEAVLPALPSQPEIRYINGHIVFASFVPLFDQLGGLRFVGNPLTEVRLNTEKSRYEQYFEKMGFYQELGDSGNQIHLLPYGMIACRQNHPDLGCDNPTAEAIIEPTAYLPQPFLPVIQRLGQDFTGQPLSQPYQTPDGMLEQVYENVVLIVDPNDLRLVSLRNLPAQVGLQPGAYEPPITDKLMAFVVIDTVNNLGHNVPTPFLEFIAEHGGTELAGPPTSALYEEHGIRRQCFTNYCLDYDPAAPADAQIHPTPLGYQYLNQKGFVAPEIKLQIWETRPIIGVGQEQVVGVMVYNTTPSQPMENIEPTVEITLPIGTVKNYILGPTSSGGTTYLNVTLPEAQTGDTVTYQVCVSQPGSEQICASEAWLVR